MDEKKKTTVFPKVTAAMKRLRPVKYTKDGTKYRGLTDFLEFTLRVEKTDGSVFVGQPLSFDDGIMDHKTGKFVNRPISMEIYSCSPDKWEYDTIREDEIASIEVLERPKDEMTCFGPVPPDDDAYWDDDFDDEEEEKEDK